MTGKDTQIVQTMGRQPTTTCLFADHRRIRGDLNNSYPQIRTRLKSIATLTRNAFVYYPTHVYN